MQLLDRSAMFRRPQISTKSIGRSSKVFDHNSPRCYHLATIFPSFIAGAPYPRQGFTGALSIGLGRVKWWLIHTLTKQASAQTPAPEKKLWGGRFTGKTDPLMEKFNESLPFDKRLWAEDIKVHAHGQTCRRSNCNLPTNCATVFIPVLCLPLTCFGLHLLGKPSVCQSSCQGWYTDS